MPNNGGVNLGAAHGSIIIDADVAGAQSQLNVFVNQVTQQFNQVNSSAQQASVGISQMGNLLRQLTGISLSIAGAVKLGQLAVDAEQTAFAYDKQLEAATKLAGGQADLNQLLEVYARDTQGALTQSEQLAAVQQLLSLRFVNNAQELDKFIAATRAVAFAQNEPQGQATDDIIAATLTRRRQALARLGIDYDEVTARTKVLRDADAGLSEEMGTLQAIVGLINDKFGDLGREAPSNVAKLRASLGDFGKELGTDIMPVVEAASLLFTNWLTSSTQLAHDLKIALTELGQSFGLLPRNFTPAYYNGAVDPMTTDLAHRTPIGNMTQPQALQSAPITDLNKAQIDWYQKTRDIEEQAANSRIDTIQQFESQRANTERSYQTEVLRETQDFGIQRQREERDSAQEIQRVHEENAQEQVRDARQLAQQIANAQSDSADRLARLQEDHDRTIAQQRSDLADRISQEQSDRDESIAKAREDSTKRLRDIDEKYNKEREKAERDHQITLTDAALEGDAKAIYEENLRYARDNKDRSDTHDKQLSDEKSKLDDSLKQIEENYDKRVTTEKRALDKQISQENDAYQRQVSDEKKALDKRVSQAQSAYDQQIADLNAADAARTTEIQNQLAQRESDENADQSLRLSRQATDHDAQLAEYENEQQKRLTQIDNQEAQQRSKIDSKFQDQLLDMGKYTDAMKDHYDALRDNAVDAFNKWWDTVQHKLTNTPVPPLNTDSPEKQLAGLRQDRADALRQQVGLDPSNPQWGVLNQRVTDDEIKINALMKQYGISASASVSASAMMAGGAGAEFGLPSSTGMLNSVRNVTINIAKGAVEVYGAANQSAQSLADVIDGRILTVLQKAARGI